jgi:hypothetical protein
VAFDGLVDFAGNEGSSAAPLRLAAFATPPLVAADGFESATGTVGGATVISAGNGPLPPITGARSVYIVGAGGPSPTTAAVGSMMNVRLAVPAGATKLRFSYRLVSQLNGGSGVTIALGSVGGHASSGDSIFSMEKGTQTVWSGAKTVLVTDVATKEVALPAGVTDELVVDIATGVDSCGPAPLPVGVLIDDLRVE